MSSLVKITKSKSSLKKAGKRIDHIHPLKFLTCVLTDNQMKASFQAMQDRSWVWGEFFSGLKDSLEEEASRGNMKIEFIRDFSLQVSVSEDLIYPSISQKKWKQFISILINAIPKNPDADRYDM